jgi:predicted nuclease of predicted toxin-antitoxin system
VRFLVDAQLPPALARWLASQGHEAEHVTDIGLASARDRDIWEYARATAAVIVSKDEDFAILRTIQSGPPAVVWLRVGNTTRRSLLTWMPGCFPEVMRALQAGELLVEVRP